MNEASNKKGASGFLASWFWWLIAGVSIITAVFAVLIATAGFEGFFGTTGIRRVTEQEFKVKLYSQITQDDLLDKREPDSNTSAARPIAYASKSDIPEKKDGIYSIDARLAKLFNVYVANGAVTDPTKRPVSHDFIELKTTDSKYSSLSMPPDNQPSISTLFRGVGVRVIGLDKIKCSYKRPCDGPTCNMTCPKDWQKFKEYPILFSSSGIDESTARSVVDFASIPGCLTMCAVDYYPTVDPKVLDQSANSKRQPAETIIENFKTLADQAADYKLAGLTGELLSTDDKVGSKPAYEGSAKLTPFSIIVPQNLKTLLEKDGDWQPLVDKANNSYFLPLQRKSGLAGLWFDEYLNGKGDSPRSIHLNY